MQRRTITMLPLVLETLLLIVLFFRLYLPLSYYVIVTALSVALVVLIIYGRLNLHVLAAIIVAGIILRMLPMIRTDFLVEPLYDGYKDIVTAELWYKAGHVPIFYGSGVLGYTSSFPLLKILTIMYAYMMGSLNPWQLLIVRSALALTLTYAFTMMISAYLLAKAVAEKLNLGVRLAYIMLLFFAISPDAIYYGMIYYPRHFSATLIYILLWMMVTGRINDEFFVPAALLMITIPFSYAGYPWILLTFIAVCYMLTLILLRKEERKYVLLPRLTLILVFGIIASWMYYAVPDLLASNLRGAFNKLIHWASIMQHKGLPEREWVETPYYIPPSLQTPFNTLTKARDVVIYAPVLMGFIYVFIKALRRGNSVCRVILTYILALTALYLLFVEIQRFSFQAVLTPFIYIVLLLSVVSYVAMITPRASHQGLRERVTPLLALLLSVAVLTAFLAPWSHRILLKHYYDPSINFVEAGDYDVRYWYIFLILHGFSVESLTNSYNVFTDRPNIIAILYPNFLKEGKIFRVLQVSALHREKYLFIVLQGLNPDLGFRSNITTLRIIRYHLTENSNMIFSIAEHLRVYIR